MTPSRYQSRLFNFFSRQSQRFGDLIGRTWRSGRVAANWSLEALFYPVFVLIQKAVDVGKQLKPQASKQQHLLKSDDGNTTLVTPVVPQSDTAIVRMLEVIKKLPSRHANSLNPVAEKLDYVKYHQQLGINDTAKAYLPKVQGIATHLGNKHLVLVTVDNKVLDILTLKQQQKLQDRIIAEVAEYNRLSGLASEQQVQNLSPEIERLLHKLTGWNAIPQVSDVAENQEVITQLSTQLSTQSYLSGLDAAVAYFESSALTVGQQAQQKLNMLNMLFSEAKICQTSQNNDQNRGLSIRTLINQAINYFFDKSTTANLGASATNIVTNIYPQPKPTAALPRFRQSTDETLDLWLTFDDLFGEQLQPEKVALPQNRFTSAPNQRLLNQYKPSGQLAISQTTSQQGCQAISQNQKKSAVSQQIESDILISNKIDSVTVKQSYQESCTDDKPEFIEISATSVEYEQHILEIILEWLDNLMLWLEDKFVRILKLIRANIRVKL